MTMSGSKRCIFHSAGSPSQKKTILQYSSLHKNKQANKQKSTYPVSPLHFFCRFSTLFSWILCWFNCWFLCFQFMYLLFLIHFSSVWPSLYHLTFFLWPNFSWDILFPISILCILIFACFLLHFPAFFFFAFPSIHFFSCPLAYEEIYCGKKLYAWYFSENTPIFTVTEANTSTCNIILWVDLI